MIREDFLQQNAFHEVDTYCPLTKQTKMLDTILSYYTESQKALDAGIYLRELLALPVREQISRMKYVDNNRLGGIDEIKPELQGQIDELISKGGIPNA